MDQVRESRITADRIELWIGFDELEDIGLLPVGQFEPIKGLFVVAGAQVCIHKCAGGNIAGLPALFQFREQPQRHPSDRRARMPGSARRLQRSCL